MRHLGLWTIAGLLISTASLFAQAGSPFPVPAPVGGPIVHPDGRIMSGMDFLPTNPWSGGVEVGLNGSEGNSQNLKLRLGGDVKYDTPDDVFIANAWYGLARQGKVLSENKALVTVRNELPIYEAIGYFTQGQLEYDQFRMVDWRIALHNGISFVAVKEDSLLLKMRIGAGASREFGGPSDKWIPEGILGGDFEYKFTERTKFLASADFYPDIANWGHYRVRAKAAFDILLDQKLNLSLRLGVMDRYDSQPGPGTKYNDLDYYLTLLFKF